MRLKTKISEGISLMEQAKCMPWKTQTDTGVKYNFTSEILKSEAYLVIFLQCTDYFIFENDNDGVEWTILEDNNSVTWYGDTTIKDGNIPMDVRKISPLDMTVLKHASLQNLIERADKINVKGFGDGDGDRDGDGGMEEIIDRVNAIILKATPASEPMRRWMIDSKLSACDGSQRVQLPAAPHLFFTQRKQQKQRAREAAALVQRTSLTTALAAQGHLGQSLNDMVDEEMAAYEKERNRNGHGNGNSNTSLYGYGGQESNADELAVAIEIVDEECCGEHWNVKTLALEKESKNGVFYLDWEGEGYQIRVNEVNNIYRGPIVVAWALSPESGKPFGDVHHYKYSEFKSLARPDLLEKHWRDVEEIKSYGGRQFVINFEGVDSDGKEEKGDFKANITSVDPAGHTVSFKYLDDGAETCGVQSFMDRLQKKPIIQKKKNKVSTNSVVQNGRQYKKRQRRGDNL